MRPTASWLSARIAVDDTTLWLPAQIAPYRPTYKDQLQNVGERLPVRNRVTQSAIEKVRLTDYEQQM